MTVSIVIPAWNDVGGVQAALKSLRKVSCVTEIIVIDDCSRQPVAEVIDVQSAPYSSDAMGAEIKILRHSENRGGGGARNTGLSAVSQPYVAFLDSDDLPTQEYGDIFEKFIAADSTFDFAMFRHIDSREAALGKMCGLAVDEKSWDQLPVSEHPFEMTLAQKVMMSAVSAYPWNKLYRTAFLREHDIGCTEIPVHNDIELHWVSFLQAASVLYTHRTGVTHFVQDHGRRITNRKGAERIRVFEALEKVCDRLNSTDQPMVMHASFWRFVNKLMRWIPNNLDPAFQADFVLRRRAFILKHLSSGHYKRTAFMDPDLGNQLIELVREKLE